MITASISEQQQRWLRQLLWTEAEGCAIFRRDRQKILFRCRAPGANEDWFGKLYLNPAWPQQLRDRCSCSGGKREFRQAQRLRQQGVSIPMPVAGFGDQRFGRGRRSLFVAEWCEEMVSLRTHVLQHYHHTKKHCRYALQDLSRALGCYLADLHARSVFPRDLNPGNLLLRIGADAAPVLMLVDYEHIAFAPRRRQRYIQLALSQLGAFLLPIDAEAVIWLCEGYASFSGSVDTALLRQVPALARRRLSRWHGQIDQHFDKIAAALRAPGD
ncbi:MAG: lipopolysaccharide kinase InaA family protein [Syntrophotaleaceae bacterium]